MTVDLPDELTCRDVVDLVTQYDEGVLDDRDRRLFEEHLAICEACVTYYEQLRQVVRVAGTLAEDAPVDPAVEAALRAAFRAAR